MTQFKIMHIGDSHLRDAQFARRDRSADFYQSLVFCIKYAHDNKLDCIIHTGDIIDQTRPSSNVIQQIREINELLKQLDMTMYVISGNHDATKPHWIDVIRDRADTGPGMRLIDNQAVELYPGSLPEPKFEAGMPRNTLRIHGLPFMSKDMLLDVLPKCEADVVMWHGTVEEFIGFPSETAVTMDELVTNMNKRTKLLALGDIHVTEFFEEADKVIGYCGSTEFCNADKDKTEKFAVIHTFNGNSIDNALEYAGRENVAIPTREIIAIRVMGETDMESAIQLIRNSRTENPIVFCKFNIEMRDAVARLKRVLKSDKAIFRSKPFAAPKTPGSNQEVDVESMTISDFLYMFLPENSDAYEMAEKLLNPKIHVLDTIDEFIEAREKLIESNGN
jgi:DNA repair exonuclease SbcCD nuclease subunit